MENESNDSMGKQAALNALLALYHSTMEQPPINQLGDNDTVTCYNEEESNKEELPKQVQSSTMLSSPQSNPISTIVENTREDSNQDSSSKQDSFSPITTAFETPRVTKEIMSILGMNAILQNQPKHQQHHNGEVKQVQDQNLAPGKKRKIFECQYCNKEFLQASHLRYHIRMHTGEKPFKCNICNKAFTQSYNLKLHMYVHMKERRYKCVHCNMES